MENQMEHPQPLTEEVTFPTGEIKMSKVEKFFHSQKEKFSTHMKGFEAHLAKKQDNIASIQADFIKAANTQIAATDKKFSGMYNHLVRQFLTSMEDRIYMNELANKTLLLMFADRLYEIEATKGGEIPTKEDFVKALEAEYVTKITEVHKTTSEANAAAAQTEVNNEEVPTVVEEPVQTEATTEAPAQ